jgi:TP901 family phage tail tape measure protein
VADRRLQLILEMKDKLSRKAGAAGKSIQGISNKVAGMRTQIAVGTAALGGIGIMSVKFAAQFDKGMREVNTLVGLGSEQLNQMSQDVRDLSKEIGLNAVDATKALYQTISAGIDPAKAVEFMGVAAKTAVGGVTELETATKGIVSVLNAWSLEASEAERVADGLFASMKAGQTTIGELSDGIFQAAPIAAALGVRFEEVSAAAAAITLAGTPTKVAFTGLRSAMISMTKPTTEMAELLAQIGFESGATALQTLGLQGTFEALLETVDGDTEALIAAGLQTESLGAIFGITGKNADKFKEILGDVETGAGGMETAFAEMEESTSQRMAKFSASMNDAKLSIGEALLPMVEKFAAVVADLANKFNDLPGPVKQGIVVLGAIAAGMGVLLLIIPPLIAMFTGLGVSISIALLGIPIVIAAIIAGVVLMVKHWDTVKMAVETAVNFMLGALSKYINFYIAVINKMIDGANKIAGLFGKTISNIDELNLSIDITGEKIEELGSQVDDFADDTMRVNSKLVDSQGEIIGAQEDTQEEYRRTARVAGEALEEIDNRTRESARVAREASQARNDVIDAEVAEFLRKEDEKWAEIDLKRKQDVESARFWNKWQGDLNQERIDREIQAEKDKLIELELIRKEEAARLKAEQDELDRIAKEKADALKAEKDAFTALTGEVALLGDTLGGHGRDEGADTLMAKLAANSQAASAALKEFEKSGKLVGFDRRHGETDEELIARLKRIISGGGVSAGVIGSLVQARPITSATLGPPGGTTYISLPGVTGLIAQSEIERIAREAARKVVDAGSDYAGDTFGGFVG